MRMVRHSLSSRHIAAVAAALLLAALVLVGCAAGNGPGSSGAANRTEDIEITRVLFVCTDGDTAGADVYVIHPDLSMEHSVLADPSLPDSLSPEDIFGEESISEEHRTISELAWESIVSEAKRVDFMTLPEDIEPQTQGYDMPWYYIHLETSDGSHAASGYAYGDDAPNRRFAYLLEYVQNAIAESTPANEA